MIHFAAVSELAEQLGSTPSRLAKRAAIAEALGTLPPREAALFVLYLSGTPFAESDPRRLNVGGALLSKIVLAVSSASQAQLTEAYRRHGDLGAAAYDLLQGVAPAQPKLTILEVAESFAALAAARSTVARSALVEHPLRQATALDAKYLLKLMLGDMRIGVKQSLVEEAIAVAANADVKAVRHAVMLEADLGAAAERAFAGTLEAARMRLFHPLGFMLASPVASPEEAVERFADAAYLEDKYDGIRAQLHCGDSTQPGRLALYSRSREEMTEGFPELAEAFAKVTDEALILDGELLAWDYTTSTALPFATMGQRIGRKRVENELRQRVPVVFMAFDVLFAQGELQLAQPLSARRQLLEGIVARLGETAQSPLVVHPPRAQASLFEAQPEPERPLPRLLLAPSRLVTGAAEIDRAYAEARARSNEGVMLKSAASPYLPGRRGIWWVKLKRELATLDVVITGAEYGHGKRAGLLSDYTFAVRDAAGELQNVGKAYSGVTDAEIAELTTLLKANTLVDHGHFREVEPMVVLEVAFNNVMRSDRHASGFALRFPRIVRLRPDKPLAEIDTVARVEEIYQSQVDKPVES